jgi:hypothetical protein
MMENRTNRQTNRFLTNKNVLIGGVLILLVVDFSFLIWAVSFPNSAGNSNPERRRNLPEGNAAVVNIWLEGHERLDIMRENDVIYLFVDIGGTNKNGTFVNPPEQMENFLDYIMDYENNTGHSFILLPYSEVRSYEINTTSSEFKRNFIGSYRGLIDKGFDGLLVDIEPVPFDERAKFIEFLEEIRAGLPEEAIISIYAGHMTARKTNNVWEWDPRFYMEVSERVDIVSAPGYDTAFTNTRDYQAHIRDQVRMISKYRNTNFLFAIPTHKQYPEQSRIALEAFDQEIAKHERHPIIGITVFAEWTANELDWNNLARHNLVGRER